MDEGSEPITDTHVLAAVRRQARRVQLRAILATILMTGFFMWLS